MATHQRRPRYSGTNPRRFRDKYKELNPTQYASEVEKVLASGKTPAGSHRPIMVAEILGCLGPATGDVAVDCTLGGGGHARAILERILPGGRLIALDADPLELPRTEAALRASGFGPDVFVAHRSNFAGLPKILADGDRSGGPVLVDMILADLGVSSMQLDNPDRGFGYKEDGPLDMRMNPRRGEPASQLIARLSSDELARLIEENADEPYAEWIAAALKRTSCDTTRGLVSLIRQAVSSVDPRLADADLALSVRRTFQALRIAVNDEFASLDALLRVLPACLAPGGRVAILTFHSGEDRRVKKAFQAGHRSGAYADIAEDALRATAEERRANPRASSAKLRWARVPTGTDRLARSGQSEVTSTNAP